MRTAAVKDVDFAYASIAVRDELDGVKVGLSGTTGLRTMPLTSEKMVEFTPIASV